MMSSQQEEEGDIFGDLLDAGCKMNFTHDAGVGSINLPFECQSFTPSSCCVTSFQGLAPDSDLEICSNVLESFVTDHYLYALVAQSGKVKVQVFKTAEDGMSRNMLMLEIPTHQSAELFTVTDHDIKRQHLYVADQEPEQPQSASKSKCSPFSLRLPKPLFISLFGKEVAFINSPVVILCTNKGSLYLCPIKRHFLHRPRFSLLCQMNAEVIGIMKVIIEFSERKSQNTDLIASLRQAIHKDPNERSVDAQDEKMSGLLLCSVTGECCLFLMPLKKLAMPPILKFFLPHSVVCCVANIDHFVYSTGSSVEACKLYLHKEGGTDREKAVENVYVTTKLFPLLKQARIQHLHTGPSSSDCSEYTTYGITFGYDCVPIPLIFEREAGDNIVDIGSNTLKGVTSSIGKTSSMKKGLQEKSSDLDSFIHQLHFLTSVLNQTEGAKLKQHNGNMIHLQSVDSVKSECTIKSSTNGYTRLWTLTVMCTNQSSTSLSGDWVLVVSVLPVHLLFSRDDYSPKATTTALQLYKGLSANSNVEVCVSLQELISECLCDSINVTVSLILNTSNVCSKIKFDEKKQYIHDTGLEVTIHKQCIDILHFLWIADDANVGVPRSNLSTSWQNANIRLEQELLDVGAKKSRQKMTVSKDVEGQALVVKIHLPSSAAQINGWKHPSEVLKTLIQDCDVNLENVNDSSCQMSSPFGNDVQIMIEQLSDKGQNGSQVDETPSYSITMKSSSIILLAAVREAVIKRLSILGSQFGTKEQVDRSNMQAYQSKLNALQEKLHSTLIELRQDNCNDQDASRILCAIFEQIRIVSL